MAIFCGLTPTICDAFAPRPTVRTADWAEAKVTLPPGSEIQGKFRLDLFPHMREPLDCCDDPYYERVTIQAASRLGKTVAAQVFLAKTADTNPHNMALADADQRSTQRVIRRTWKLLDGVASLAPKLPPRRQRSQDRIQFSDCCIEGAWSGSAATAADYAAWIVVLNEIDKMSKRTSEEADFAHLMAERCKGFRGATVLRISTPSVKGQSRVEQFRLSGDNRARHVPCPHCNHFQTLRLGDGSKGGLCWQKDKQGKSSPQIAFENAWYECEKCGKKILDEHRYKMLNAGVWVKEGQSIDRRGRITGKALREGPDASFGPLSTLHSLLPSITWGRIAKEFLEANVAAQGGDRERLRNFCNSWMGESWDPRPVRVRVHELAERLEGIEPQSVCPAWSVFLTRAVDVGGHFDEFHWQVCAWGPHKRGQLIDYGVSFKEADLESIIRTKIYPHADGGPALRASRTGIDSGSGKHTDSVYAFCDRVPGCVPLKGLTGKFPELVKIAAVGQEDQANKIRRAAAGFGGVSGARVLYEVNHEQTQRWIQALIDGDVTAAHAHFFSLCQEATLDTALLQQFLNEFPSEERNDDGYLVHKWVRTGPNEQRDLARYNRALASVLMRNDANWGRIKRIPVDLTSVASAEPRRGLTLPDGRPFLVTER